MLLDMVLIVDVNVASIKFLVAAQKKMGGKIVSFGGINVFSVLSYLDLDIDRRLGFQRN